MRLSRAVSFLLFGTALFAPAKGQQYTISTFASGAPPPTPTLSADSTIGYPGALASDDVGNVYFVSFNRVFRLDGNGMITGSPGSPPLVTRAMAGRQSTRNCPVQAASRPTVQAIYSFADIDNHRIRKVSVDGIITTITGNGALFAAYAGDGGPASSATGVWGPLAVDGAGNLIIASGGHIRNISSDGMITTIPGDGASGSPIAADRAANMYIADLVNNAMRILRPVNGPF
jgi:trimeric autotransporter adhesin